MAVAEEMFARDGIATTSTRQITAAAGTNSDAIHYHFGSKGGLVRQTFESRIEQVDQLITAALSDRRGAGCLRYWPSRFSPWMTFRTVGSTSASGSGSVPSELADFGLPMLDGPGRVRRLDETLRVVKGFCSGANVAFDGEFHRVWAPAMCAPPGRPTPVVIGGTGSKTLDLVARHADWSNVPVDAVDRMRVIRSRPGTARVSLQQVVAFVRTEAERSGVRAVAERHFGGFGPGLVLGRGTSLWSTLANSVAPVSNASTYGSPTSPTLTRW
jgi:AcrR family transcriptional regulator